MKKTKLLYFFLLLALFWAGVYHRMFLGKLVPQPFLFDQTEYSAFATQILEKGLVAWQPRLYGYPLFLAVIYKIFGIGNFTAVLAIQSVLDCLTAVLIYLTAMKIFKKKVVALFAYLLYLANPFTSVFCVLTLSEIWAIFLVTLIMYLLSNFAEVNMSFSNAGPAARVSQTLLHKLALVCCAQTSEAKSLGVPRSRHPLRLLLLSALLALLLGYLPQVRPSFLFFSLAVFLGLLLGIIRVMGDMRVIIISVFLFILPFTYNIIGNWVYFREASPTTVDNLFVRELYVSLYVARRAPVHANQPSAFPIEVQNLYNEYTPKPQNAEERSAMAQKYLSLAAQKIAKDPLEFVYSKLLKFWYVWEKHFIYYYTQPDNPVINFLTYWGNNASLFLAAIGMWIFARGKLSQTAKVWLWLAIFTVGYISLVHAFSLTEERFSLPGYPIIYMFDGYIIYLFGKKLKII